MKKVILVFLIFLLAGILSAQESSNAGSAEIKALSESCLSSGNTVPALSFPLLPPELDALAMGPENPQDVEDDGGIIMSEKVEVNFQAFFNNRDVNSFSIYDFIDKEPIAVLGLGLSDMETAGFYIEAFGRAEYDKTANMNLFNPKSENPISIDNYFLQYGYFWYNFNPLLLTFGRIPVHFGHPEFSSILPSNKLPYMDSLYLKLPLGFVTMNMVVSSLENRESVPDVNPDPAASPDLPYEFGNNTILTALHRFDMNWGNFSFSASGFSIISRQNNNFNLADFFPVFTWHTADVGWHNLSMIFEASWCPLSGLDLYLQAGFDDINAADLFGIDDTGNPTIDAYIAGVYIEMPLFSADFMAKGEFGYTHYLWGNFYNGTEADYRGNHVFERAIYRYQMDFGPRIIPLTSPYGPGALWAELNVSLSEFYNFDFNLDLLYLEKINGVNLINTPYERNDDIRETNGVTRSFDATLNLRYSPFEWLELAVSPGILFSDGETDIHIDLLVTYKDKFIQKLD